MSWNKSASGKRIDVYAAAGKWGDEQRATDAGMSKEAIEGHQAQVRAAVRAINQFGTDVGNVELSIEAWGHHNGDPQSSQGGVKISYYVPVAAKTE
jgi:hypothetical protein